MRGVCQVEIEALPPLKMADNTGRDFIWVELY